MVKEAITILTAALTWSSCNTNANHLTKTSNTMNKKGTSSSSTQEHRDRRHSSYSIY